MVKKKKKEEKQRDLQYYDNMSDQSTVKPVLSGHPREIL